MLLIQGNDCRQGTHQEAQKSTSTTLPRKARSDTVPDPVGSVKSGAAARSGVPAAKIAGTGSVRNRHSRLNRTQRRIEEASPAEVTFHRRAMGLSGDPTGQVSAEARSRNSKMDKPYLFADADGLGVSLIWGSFTIPHERSIKPVGKSTMC